MPTYGRLYCHWKLHLFFIGAEQSTYYGDLFDKTRQRSQESKSAVFPTPWLQNLGSTNTLVAMFRLWTRRFTMIISAW